MKRHTVLLALGIFCLALSIWGIYDIYRPKVGPLGSGIVPWHSRISIFSGFYFGIFGLFMGYKSYRVEKNEK